MSQLNNMWRYIRRTPYQAYAAVSVMLLTFWVAGLFFILSLGSAVVLKFFEQKPEVIVFFKDTKTVEAIKQLQEKLTATDKIAQTKFVSKDDALIIYKEQFKNDPLLLEMVSADILPASLEISAKDIKDLPQLANLIKNESEISEIVFPEEVVNLLVSWTTVFRKFGLVLVVFLGLVSLFTVITVIGMKLALRKQEIEILQLVGASGNYIRMPFLLEGGFYGFCGSFFGWLVNIGLLLYITPFLETLFSGIPLFPIPIAFYFIFLGGMLVAGVSLGMFASMLALSRYLR